MRIVLTVTLAACSVGTPAWEQPALGTATLSGRVTDSRTERPLDTATVKIIEVDRTEAQIVTKPDGREVTVLRPRETKSVTNADGRYVFEGVPGGRYRVVASHSGFVDQTYGASELNLSAGAIEMEPGQRRENINFTLIRGGILSGKVTDQQGQPLANANVAAINYAQGRMRITGRGHHNDKCSGRIQV